MPLRALPLLLLTFACSAPQPPVSSPTDIQAGLGWRTQVGGSGIALTLHQADGSALLRLACTRNPAELIVTGEAFRAIGSEERLTLGVGDQAFALVADPTSPAPSGVEARGPMPAGLLEQLEGAASVSASYGAQRIGPHIPPDPEAARAFVAGCRAAAA